MSAGAANVTPAALLRRLVLAAGLAATAIAGAASGARAEDPAGFTPEAQSDEAPGGPPAGPAGEKPGIRVGSKAFQESVILGEIVRYLIEEAGYEVRHKQGLGGTQICWRALLAGEIDLYPDYTGTILEEILASEDLDSQARLRAALNERGVRMTAPLGFNNTYAIGVRGGLARRLGLETISDLAKHPDLVVRFSNEFMDRADGWPGLRAAYDLPHADVKGIEHQLAYRGIDSGKIDVTDLYSTDAEIRVYDLVVLEDDRNYFPDYSAVFLYRSALERTAPAAVEALRRLEGEIPEPRMVAMNMRVKRDKVPEAQAAAEFVRDQMQVEARAEVESLWQRLARNTANHLFLVGVSMAGAIVLAVPLGIAAAREPTFGQVILALVGILQTIPALALLFFMVPLLGIEEKPAIAALFLYSLLPIVRNTHAGLVGISPSIRESAQALGLPAGARLRRVELPLALRSILAGVKISAVINVGTATLGGLIGAGGYGQAIMTGIRRDDLGTIMEGAIPAAVLAILVHVAIELLERLVVPKGLRLKVRTQ